MASLITRSASVARKLLAEGITPAAVIEPTAVDFAELAASAIKQHESDEERARRAATAARVAMERDAWDEVLRQRLRDYYHQASYEALVGGEEHVDLSDNLFRDIVSELAVLYQQPPARSIERDGEAMPESIVRYESLFGEVDGELQLQLFWQSVNVALEAFEDLILWPSVQETPQGKRVVGRWAAGDAYSVIVDADDQTMVRQVVLQLPPRAPKTRRYAFWTDAWMGVFEADEHGRNVVQVAPDDFANAYGRLPFVHVHNAGLQPLNYWNTTRGRDLVDATLQNGERRQQLRYSHKMSSYKQGVAMGPDVEKMPPSLRDEGALIRIVGSDTQFQIVDWQINFGARLDVMSADRQMVAASRGINPERMKRSGSYQTAEGAKGADRGLIERREKKAPIYKIAEQAFYQSVVMVAQHHAIDGAGKLSQRDKLRVEFGQMAYPADPAKRLELDKEEAALGTKSLVQIVRERHPEMSAEQAEEFLRTNIELNAELAKIKMEHAVARQLTTRSSIDEDNGRQGPAVRDGLTPPGSPPDTQAIGD